MYASSSALSIADQAITQMTSGLTSLIELNVGNGLRGSGRRLADVGVGNSVMVAKRGYPPRSDAMAAAAGNGRLDCGWQGSLADSFSRQPTPSRTGTPQPTPTQSTSHHFVPHVPLVPPGRHKSRHWSRSKSQAPATAKRLPQIEHEQEEEYDNLMRRLDRIEAETRHVAQSMSRDHNAILNTGNAVENLEATMNNLNNGLAQNVLRPISNLRNIAQGQEDAMKRQLASEIRDHVIKISKLPPSQQAADLAAYMAPPKINQAPAQAPAPASRDFVAWPMTRTWSRNDGQPGEIRMYPVSESGEDQPEPQPIRPPSPLRRNIPDVSTLQAVAEEARESAVGAQAAATPDQQAAEMPARH